MAPAKRTPTRQEVIKQSAAVMPLIALCGIAVSACIAFGNPFLWVSNEQLNSDGSEVQNTTNTPQGTVGTPSPSPSAETDTSSQSVISQYEAVSQSDDVQRTVNIQLAAEAINGIEIAPGETFSFNDAIGDTEHDDRYQLAPVVYGSEMIYAKGGGICQVSTSLYIAALMADMEVVERHPHSIAVDYAPIGLDATLVYGVMDLQLKNTSEHPITIEAVAEGQTVTVKLLGEPLEDGIKIEAVAKMKPDAEIPAEYDTSAGQMYYVVESYRNYKKDGNVIESQHLATDVYQVPKSTEVTLTDGGVDPTK